MTLKQNKSTIDQSEIRKFEQIADEWWDMNGNFRPLHKLNPARIAYLKDTIISKFGAPISTAEPLSGIKLLDIGCGGGLIALPMHNLGAEVTAIDASKKNIEIASIYAKKQAIDLNFRHATTADLCAEKELFDVVLALEVIEHVSDYPQFLDEISRLVTENGIIIISTINRSMKSLMQAKILAEYVLRLVPQGTHEYNKFLKPSEIEEHMHAGGFQTLDITGVKMDIFGDWALSDDYSVNYFISFVKA